MIVDLFVLRKAHILGESVKLMRVSQYTKNGFIFLPLFFSGNITQWHLLFLTLLGAFAFSLVSSAIYIFNDYHDRESDQKHPIKCKRPLAANTIPIPTAMALLVFCAVIGLALGVYLNIFLYLLLYAGLNILYSLKSKHIAILDVLSVASGFIIRIFVGGAIGSIILSHWIVLITFLLALFLALAKRRDDVLIFLNNGYQARKSIDGYNLEFLNIALVIVAALFMVSYIMYVTSQQLYNYLYLTVIIVIAGVMRYLQIIFVEKNSGSPSDILLKDPFLQISIILWGLFYWLCIY